MNILKYIKQNPEKKSYDELDKESKLFIHADEFNGRLYLCYCGVPLDAEWLTRPLVEIIAEAREVWKLYQEEK